MTRSDIRQLLKATMMTLEHLEKRFGGEMSIGELRASLWGQLQINNGTPFTITDAAKALDQPISSVSRRVRNHPLITLVENEDDARSKWVVPAPDSEHMMDYLQPMALALAALRDATGPFLPVENVTDMDAEGLPESHS